MKLADASPGDFLQDRDGGMWLRGKEMAVCLHDPADKHDGDCNSFGADAMVIEEAEQFGPFVRLVPETESARLQSELDALRAIIESGCEQCAAHKGLDAVISARAITDAWQAHGRDLDAEVVGGVKAARDDLRGLADKGAT